MIFFAGSFAFFKDDIAAWQKNTSFVSEKKVTVKDFNKVIDSLAEHHNLKGRNFDFTVQRHEMGAYVNMSPSMDSTLKKKPKLGEVKKEGRGGRRRGDGDSAFFTYNFASQKQSEYSESYDMGEFLYRLHFLAQLNVVPIRVGVPFGYLLAGVVSFIFLFALITGLMLHWNKIVSNFFVFRPFSKWKTVWTDLHTALGVIGFPFQFIFAVTGVVLIVNSFLITPYSKFLYQGDSKKLYQDLEYSDDTEYPYSYTALTSSFDLNVFVRKVEAKWDQARIKTVSVRNYEDANMHIIVTSVPNPQVRFSGVGKIVYRVHDQKVLYEKSPLENSTYVDKVKNIIYHLHFGDFGGRPVRVMYFVLGILGCVVIISGILIWLVARDKDNVPSHKRKFNFWTANIFLSVCLSMLPVTAFTMVVILFLGKATQSDIYHWYFYSWLALSVYFIVRRNLTLTNRQTLILSVITCFSVPIFHGILRSNWMWNTFARQAYDLLFIDLLFLTLAILSAIVLWKMRNKELGKAE